MARWLRWTAIASAIAVGGNFLLPGARTSYVDLYTQAIAVDYRIGFASRRSLEQLEPWSEWAAARVRDRDRRAWVFCTSEPFGMWRAGVIACGLPLVPIRSIHSSKMPDARKSELLDEWQAAVDATPDTVLARRTLMKEWSAILEEEMGS